MKNIKEIIKSGISTEVVMHCGNIRACVFGKLTEYDNYYRISTNELQNDLGSIVFASEDIDRIVWDGKLATIYLSPSGGPREENPLMESHVNIKPTAAEWFKPVIEHDDCKYAPALAYIVVTNPDTTTQDGKLMLKPQEFSEFCKKSPCVIVNSVIIWNDDMHHLMHHSNATAVLSRWDEADKCHYYSVGYNGAGGRTTWWISKRF